MDFLLFSFHASHHIILTTTKQLNIPDIKILIQVSKLSTTNQHLQSFHHTIHPSGLPPAQIPQVKTSSLTSPKSFLARSQAIMASARGSSDIKSLVALKHAEQTSASTQVLTPTQSALASSSRSITSSGDREVHSPTSAQNTTHKTTPESTQRTPPEAAASTVRTLSESASATIQRASLEPRDPIVQKDSNKPKPEEPTLEVDWRIWYPDPIAIDKWVRSLSPIERLEYFVRIKIKTFRDHFKVHIPLYCRQWEIDREEDARRRKFFEKHGATAFEAQYIDSNYVGHVEFLLVDPEETIWLERTEHDGEKDCFLNAFLRAHGGNQL